MSEVVAIPVPRVGTIGGRSWRSPWRVVAGGVVVALVAAVVVSRIGASRWANETQALEQNLAAASQAVPSARIDRAATMDVPEPVRRYFQIALREGQPPIRVARFSQSGQLRAGIESPTWLSFTAREMAAPLARGFVWDARIRLAPLVHAGLRDAYMDGSAHARVALQSAVTVSEERDTPALNAGDLYRLLAEGPWYPTMLLPRQGLVWTAGDRPDRAVATLTDHGTSVSVEFRFNDAGEVASIFAAARPRQYGTTYIDTPWEGRFGRYVSVAGMRVPSTGEVGWWVDRQWFPVWKATLADFSFEF